MRTLIILCRRYLEDSGIVFTFVRLKEVKPIAEINDHGKEQ